MSFVKQGFRVNREHSNSQWFLNKMHKNKANQRIILYLIIQRKRHKRLELSGERSSQKSIKVWFQKSQLGMMVRRLKSLSNRAAKCLVTRSGLTHRLTASDRVAR